jgi:hydrogenase maturation protein HypF
VLDPRGLWPQLLADLACDAPTPLVAARFHVALAAGLARLCDDVALALQRAGQVHERVVALSGGCLQNAVLYELLESELRGLGFAVLAHAEVPTHDGGIALGQALVTLARCALREEMEH